MNKSEILEALQQMNNRELLEIIETASQIMQQEISEKARLKKEKNQRLQAAMKAALPDYELGGALHELWSPESEDYYNELEYLSNSVKSNA